MRALRVLVVEDDLIIGLLLGEMLEGMGHQVCAVESTEGGALSAAMRFEPDLMIVDARLSDGCGIAVVDKIGESRSIAHLFISGDISRVKALKPRAVAVQKPFSVMDLAFAMQRALDANALASCSAMVSAVCAGAQSAVPGGSP